MPTFWSASSRPRVLSTDEPGGRPDLVRQALGDPKADVRTVHRLDRVVSGLMVLARNAESASELSRQIREGVFGKEYLAVVHGEPPEKAGELRDLLGRGKARRMTFVAEEPGKGIQEAVLGYRVLHAAGGLSRVRIRLCTGRTHQIRVQFASPGIASGRGAESTPCWRTPARSPPVVCPSGLYPPHHRGTNVI